MKCWTNVRRKNASDGQTQDRRRLALDKHMADEICVGRKMRRKMCIYVKCV
jgi:hypothetical protein